MRAAWIVFVGFLACTCGSPGGEAGTSDVAVDVAADAAADEAADAASDAAPEVAKWEGWKPGCEGEGTGAAWTNVHDETFARGPAVQLSDRDTVTILWRTAAPSAEQGCVEYRVAGKTGKRCGAADANGQYEVALDDLPPGTEIPYTAAVGASRTAEMTFRTMPDRPKRMKIAVFADAHDREERLARFSKVALAEGVDLAVGVGDLTGEGLPEQWDRFFRGIRDLAARVNVWTVIGNHDSKNTDGYMESVAMPHGNDTPGEERLAEGWWARRVGNVWLGGGWIRDFYLSMPDTEIGQIGWFRRQFQGDDFKTARWRLFFIHEPAYNVSWGGCEMNGESCLQRTLVPLMAQNGFQASFHGHMHGIEWGPLAPGYTAFTVAPVGGDPDPGDCPVPEGFPQPWYSIYGNQAFAIVETGCDVMTVRFVDLDGKELGRVEVPAGAR